MLPLVLRDVIVDRPLGDRSNDQPDQPAHQHGHERPRENRRCGIAGGNADDDRGGEADKPEAGCDDSRGNDHTPLLVRSTHAAVRDMGNITGQGEVGSALQELGEKSRANMKKMWATR